MPIQGGGQIIEIPKGPNTTTAFSYTGNWMTVSVRGGFPTIFTNDVSLHTISYYATALTITGTDISGYVVNIDNNQYRFRWQDLRVNDKAPDFSKQGYEMLGAYFSGNNPK